MCCFVKWQESQEVDITSGVREEPPHQKRRRKTSLLCLKVECEQDQDINGSFGYPRVCT